MSSIHPAHMQRQAICTGPVDPASLVGDEWMNDPIARAEFERGLHEFDEAMKPLVDAIRDSERITEKDLAIVINARG